MKERGRLGRASHLVVSSVLQLPLIKYFLLIALTLALELPKPAFGDILSNRIDHPLRNVAHYVEAIDEEHFCDLVAEIFVKSWLEDKAYDD